MRPRTSSFLVPLSMIAALGCDVATRSPSVGGGPPPDASAPDSGGPPPDASAPDSDGPPPQDAGAPDSGSPVPRAEVNIAGRWAMFAFEDPVAIEIGQTGNTLSGVGCYNGLPTRAEPRDPTAERFCAPLKGSIEGRHVQFSFASPEAPYAADVYVSADGRRMAGRFHTTADWTASFAWLRIGSDDRWLLGPATPTPALASRAGFFTLQPVGAPPAAIAAGPDGYALRLSTDVRGTQIAGSLGSFWATEMTWNATDQTLTAGPVPVSSAATPTKVVLRFDGRNLQSCEATMPDGAVFAFTATRTI